MTGRGRHVPATNASEGHVRRARGEAIHDPTLQSARGKRIPPKAGAIGLNLAPGQGVVEVRPLFQQEKSEADSVRSFLARAVGAI